jgi:hypothetical protein
MRRSPKHRLEALGLPVLPDVREEFEALAERLGVKASHG